jgi:hypothetical protein
MIYATESLLDVMPALYMHGRSNGGRTNKIVSDMNTLMRDSR